MGDGSFLIADGFSNSVLHFDSRGRFQRTFGQKGEGPGEFRFVSAAGFVAGDVVGLGDDHAFKLELFELGSGAHIGAVKMSTLVDDYVVRGDTLWFAGMNTENWTSVGFIPLDEVLNAASAGGGDRPFLSPSLLDVPRLYAENEVVLGMLPKVSLDVFEGRLLVGFAASPTLFAANASGAVLNSVAMPVARRRGLPEEDYLLALERGPELTRIFGEVSILVKVSHDSRGPAPTPSSPHPMRGSRSSRWRAIGSMCWTSDLRAAEYGPSYAPSGSIPRTAPVRSFKGSGSMRRG